MNAIPSDDRRAAVPAAGAALPVADLLPDKGPTATSAVLHTPGNHYQN